MNGLGSTSVFDKSKGSLEKVVKRVVSAIEINVCNNGVSIGRLRLTIRALAINARNEPVYPLLSG